MFPIYEVSAAPHFPQPMKSAPTLRPETIISTFAMAAEGSSDFEIAIRDGEIFIALTAS